MARRRYALIGHTHTGSGTISISLNELTNVDITSAGSDDLLQYNGADWVNVTEVADSNIPESAVTQHEAAIDHDALTNFVAAEHIDWSSNGAEDIHDNRIAESSVTQHEGAIDHDSLTNFVAAEHIDWSVTGAEDIDDDRIAESSVTQHEAALSIAESQIADGSILARLAANETVTGDWAYSGTVNLQRAVPFLQFTENDQSADEQIWALQLNSKTFRIDSYEAGYTNLVQPFRVIRGTGSTIDEIELNATLLDFNGNVDISGDLTASSFGGIDSGDLLDKSADEVVTGAWTFTHTYSASSQFPAGINLISSTPFILFNETDAPADNKEWDIGPAAQVFRIRAISDDGQSIGTAVLIRRTGAGIDEIELNADDIDINAAVNVESTLTVGGEIIAAAGGSQNDPQIRFSNDTNTGLFSNTVGELSISAAGDRQVLITDGLVSFDESVLVSGALSVPVVQSGDDSSRLILWGGDSDGASIDVYGPSHATEAERAYYNADRHTFRSADAGTTFLRLEAAGVTANEVWTFSEQPIFEDDILVRGVSATLKLSDTTFGTHDAYIYQANDGHLVLRPDSGNSDLDFLWNEVQQRWQSDTDFFVSGETTAQGGLSVSNGMTISGVATINGRLAINSVNLNSGDDLDSLAGSGFYSWTNSVPSNADSVQYASLLQLEDGAQDKQIMWARASGNGTYRLGIRRADSGSYGSWQYVGFLANDETVTGAWTFEDDVTVDGGSLYIEEAASASADSAGFGQIWVRNDAPNQIMFTDDAGNDQLIDPSRSAINGQNGNYTLVYADKGKTIHKSSGGSGETFTIPANSSVAFSSGTMVAFSNSGGGDLTIAITSDTLVWAADGSTGSRTLADDGLAVAIKVDSTTWKIAGDGLS